MFNPSLVSLIFIITSSSTTPTLLSCSPASPAKESHSSLPKRHMRLLLCLRKHLPLCPYSHIGFQTTQLSSRLTPLTVLLPPFSPSSRRMTSYIYEVFHIWCHYLEGSAAPIDIVTDHKNLEYFATTKLLNHCQVQWSEFLLQFNLIICFHSGKLGTKPDTLTHCWNVYLKEGGSNYATVNQQNLKPIFSQEQLATSLRTTKLYATAVSGAYVIDIDQL